MEPFPFHWVADVKNTRIQLLKGSDYRDEIESDVLTRLCQYDISL